MTFDPLTFNLYKFCLDFHSEVSLSLCTHTSCMFLCSHECKGTFAYVYASVCRLEVDTECPSQSLSTLFLRHSLSLNLELSDLVRLAGQWATPGILPSPSPQLQITGACSLTWLLHVCRELTSRPHACVTSPLPTFCWFACFWDRSSCSPECVIGMGVPLSSWFSFLQVSVCCTGVEPSMLGKCSTNHTTTPTPAQLLQLLQIHSAGLCFSLEGLLTGSSLMDLAACLPVALMNHLGVHLDISVVLCSEMLCVVSLNC